MLLKTEMGAGHGGPSGRYDLWKEEAFIAANVDFFGPAVTGWGAPGGADPAHVSTADAALVADFPVRPR